MSKNSYLPKKIRQDAPKACEQLYNSHKDEFIHDAKKFAMSQEDLTSIYQDSVIALYQVLVTTQTKKYDADLKTPLFEIGFNKINNKLLAQGHTTSQNYNAEIKNEIAHINNTLTKRQELLCSHLNEVSKNCQKSLKQYYYQNLDYSEIVPISTYKDEAAIETAHTRCLNRLFDLVKNKE